MTKPIFRTILLGLGLIRTPSISMAQSPDAGSMALRLEHWIAGNAVPIKDALKPGATMAVLDTLERTMQCRLPDAMRRFYMQRNGQKDDLGGVFEGEELLSAERIMAEWKVWDDLLMKGEFKDIHSAPDQGIKNDWWNPKWIPLTYDGHGNHYCLDLDPAPGGHAGQIIRMWHDASERELISASFEQWMSDYVKALEAGKYVYSEDAGGVVSKEEAREYER